MPPHHTSIPCRFESLRPGAVLILTSHKLPSVLFECVFEGKLAASWGEVTARVFKRKSLPKWVAGIVGRK